MGAWGETCVGARVGPRLRGQDPLRARLIGLDCSARPLLSTNGRALPAPPPKPLFARRSARRRLL